jgi:hypothetical protein
VRLVQLLYFRFHAPAFRNFHDFGRGRRIPDATGNGRPLWDKRKRRTSEGDEEGVGCPYGMTTGTGRIVQYCAVSRHCPRRNGGYVANKE